MNVIKKYTAIKLETRRVDNTTEVILTYNYDGYMKSTITETFDTEEEAIKAAYECDKYGTWLIVPKVTFNDF